jgi:hypothetical protein
MLYEYEEHLRQIFELYIKKCIRLAPKKSFFGFPLIQLLEQKVNAFNLITDQEKLKAIR